MAVVSFEKSSVVMSLCKKCPKRTRGKPSVPILGLLRAPLMEKELVGDEGIV